jgi:Spy/CpxP family protein refolding chaperone
MGGMNKVILIFLFIAILPRAGLAQGPPWKKGWEDRGGGGMMMGPMQPPMKDWVSQLRLTPDQVQKIQESREAFLRDTLAWRDELAGKRFDLRNLLRDPTADPQAILNKQREVFELDSKIQERSLLHQIEIRKVLTPEQIKLLPPHWGGMFGPPMTPGRGRGMGREY